MRVPDDLAKILDTQRQLATRAQCVQAGVPESTLRSALGRSVHVVLPRVYAFFSGSLDPAQRLLAGQLFAGTGAQLASFDAVRWHGIGSVPDDGLLRFLVGPGQAPRRAGFVVVRRTRRPDPAPWQRDELTVCSRQRALVDAARELRSRDEARALLVSAVQRRHVRAPDLWAELNAGPVRGSAATRAALLDVAAGAWSVPEADLLRGLARSSVLPRVWPNPQLASEEGLVLPSPDAWVDDVGLAIQVHSRSYHQRDEDWEGTVAGDTLLGEHGITVLAVTPSQLSRDLAAFVARVERTYRRLLRRGVRPTVRMVPRGPGQVM